MKTLSVKQPWSYLICSGLKDVENRTWRTEFRGRILIHASAKLDQDGVEWLIETAEEIGIDRHPRMPKTLNWFKLGSIIGSVEIVDCVQNSPSVWAEEGCYHWVLKDPVLYNVPIPAKGSLSLWEHPTPDEEGGV